MIKKAIIAMSGGVDSSVAAYLMKESGYESIGITMRLFTNEDIGISWSKTCCSLKDIEDASNACSTIGIPFYVNDFTHDFQKEVVEKFIHIYQNGGTPNPCIDCNSSIKFPKLLLRAKQLCVDYIVTGHYARIEYNDLTGQYYLKKALDSSKDQTYFLYTLTQDMLAHILFPLGNLLKSDVRKIAKSIGILNAEKVDSQDICFVPDGNYTQFIETYTGVVSQPGNFIDINGKVLGTHQGLIRYTIGQRRGLGIALNKPMYVHSKNIIDNTVVLCEDSELFSNSLIATNFNWINKTNFDTPLKIKAKIRYNQDEENAIATKYKDDSVLIHFENPQRAIAPGQAVVLYDDDVVVGGGTISVPYRQLPPAPPQRRGCIRNE